MDVESEKQCKPRRKTWLVCLVSAVSLAFVLWTVMFSPLTAEHVPFWHTMTASAVVLTVLALLFGGNPFAGLKNGCSWRRIVGDVMLGVTIAAFLWGVFWVGDKVSQWMFPSFARVQVNSIYGMKEGMPAWVLSLLLLFIIGPAEEIFWRGYVQRVLTGRLQLWGAVVAVALYALVHLFSLNFMLIMAALVCGVVWGGFYLLFPDRLPALVISHALWDAAVFVWFPI